MQIQIDPDFETSRLMMYCSSAEITLWLSSVILLRRTWHDKLSCIIFTHVFIMLSFSKLMSLEYNRMPSIRTAITEKRLYSHRIGNFWANLKSNIKNFYIYSLCFVLISLFSGRYAGHKYLITRLGKYTDPGELKINRNRSSAKK